jgi:hypothetical protein
LGIIEVWVNELREFDYGMSRTRKSPKLPSPVKKLCLNSINYGNGIPDQLKVWVQLQEKHKLESTNCQNICRLPEFALMGTMVIWIGIDIIPPAPVVTGLAGSPVILTFCSAGLYPPVRR